MSKDSKLANSIRAKRRRRFFIAAAICWTLIGGLFVAGSRAQSNSGDDVIHFLDQTIDWYHRVGDLNQSQVNSEEVVFRDMAHQNSLQVLRLGFQFGLAQAAIDNSTTGSGTTTRSAPGSRGANLAQAAANADQQVAQIQIQLGEINEQISLASSTSRPSLEARRDRLVALQNLETSRRDALKKLAVFNSSQAQGGGLLEKVMDLQQSVPESVTPSTTAAPAEATSSTPPSATAANAPEAFRPETAGVLGLVEELFTLTRQMSQINSVADQTARLSRDNQKLRDPLRPQLLDAIHRGDALATTRESDDPRILTAQRQELETLAARFKLLSEAAVPLGEQSTLLEAAHTNLIQWHDAVGRAYGRTLRYLLFRLIGMAVAIFILVGISEIWRRATFRYVSDVRRRRQFLLLRRIVVGCFIAVIIVAGVVTEIGSLATFAGLITAGIAVSLQTVIVSGVAYFFLIGRFGVRVGDRVTISGISGDVVEVGLFRLYLMELAGTPPDLQRTGRVVVFSNSVLFGGSAFFKQLPGADYNWHQVAMTLSPESNIHLAEKLFMAAVNSVVAEYQEEIDRQHVAVNQTLHLQLPSPKPESRLKFADAGLEFIIRYPVELHHGTETDDKITRKLLETIEKEPTLKLVPSGTPRIQAAS